MGYVSKARSGRVAGGGGGGERGWYDLVDVGRVDGGGEEFNGDLVTVGGGDGVLVQTSGRLGVSACSRYCRYHRSWWIPQDVFWHAVFRVDESFGLGVSEQRKAPGAHGRGGAAQRGEHGAP